MPTLDDFNNIDHDAVLDAMNEWGLDVAWEYPGVASIDVTPTVQVWTGLHSYAYGDVSVLNPEDDSWEPLEPGGALLRLEEYETDPERIAEAWSRWVTVVRTAIWRAKFEISEDIESGQTPADVPSFSALHDHADANEYGGLTEPDVDRDVFGFDDIGIDNINTFQSIIDYWLRKGRRG